MADYKYRPDYKKLYPGITITAEVMAVLKESDRKMEYMEYDIKAERFQADPKNNKADFLPSREDSLDRLMELKKEFRDDAAQPEAQVLRQDEIHRLHIALKALNEQDALLLRLRYWEGKSQQEAAAELGISQQLLSYRERVILRRLKKLL